MPPEEIIVIEKEIETVTVLSETIAGPQGLPGGSILYGSGAPNNSLGNAGDSYIDTDVGDLYAKDQIGWNLELSLIGPQGDIGPQGATGPAGTDGRTILNGSGAPSNGTGTNGDFYIDLSNSRLYGPKSAGAWGSYISLVGATGATGATGAAGADGKTVRNGSGAPSSGLGVDGDFYINTANYDLYGPKTSGAWGSPHSLVGPTGATGATGPAGADGADAVVHEGTAELDFGATPTDSGSVVITGQTGILTTSRPRAWFVSRATTDNSAADHEQAAARCVVICSEPIADTGFTISVFCQGYVTGKFSIEWSWI